MVPSLTPLLGDVLNVVTVTDVHSWWSGHRHEPYLNADIGDFASFIEHVRDVAAEQGRDLIVVDNGDQIDGTGLSDATLPNGVDLFPLLNQLDIDLFNLGNHELYKNDTVNLMDEAFFEDAHGSVLTSNVIWEDTRQPLSDTHQVMRGNFGANCDTVLALGFLYEMRDHCEAVEVLSMEAVTQAPWFVEAISNPEVDAILVLGHMSVTAGEFQTLLTAIRAVDDNAEMPVLFIAGHSHRRNFERYDSHAAVFQASRELDTVGIISASVESSRTWFDFDYVDGNVAELMAYSNKTAANFVTTEGQRMKEELQATRDRIRLDEEVGCSPRTYTRSAGLSSANSAWGLYIKEVVPKAVLQTGASPNHPLLVERTGSLRYSLYEGLVIRDDVFTLAPFRNAYRYIPGIRSADAAVFLYESLRVDPSDFNSTSLPTYVYSEDPVDGQVYDIIFTDYDEAEMVFRVAATLGVSSVEVHDYGVETDSSLVWIEYMNEHFPSPPCSGNECPATCNGRSCDDWYFDRGTTCAENESIYGCDCTGCVCLGDTGGGADCPATCNGRTCDDWFEDRGSTCAANEEMHGCDCSGCECLGDRD